MLDLLQSDDTKENLIEQTELDGDNSTNEPSAIQRDVNTLVPRASRKKRRKLSGW